MRVALSLSDLEGHDCGGCVAVAGSWSATGPAPGAHTSPLRLTLRLCFPLPGRYLLRASLCSAPGALATDAALGGSGGEGSRLYWRRGDSLLIVATA